MLFVHEADFYLSSLPCIDKFLGTRPILTRTERTFVKCVFKAKIFKGKMGLGRAPPQLLKKTSQIQKDLFQQRKYSEIKPALCIEKKKSCLPTEAFRRPSPRRTRSENFSL